MDSPAAGHRVTAQILRLNNGVEHVLLQNNQGAIARVCLKGAQVLSWKTPDGEELFFTSRKAILNSTVAVRGGISVCFPQYERRGILDRHGFARNRTWIIDNSQSWPPPNDSIGRAYVDLLLKPSEMDLRIWPHRFEYYLRLCLNSDGHLILLSRIRNVDRKPFSFTTAFHTYFSISNISEVRIEGLEYQNYLDNLLAKVLFTDQGNAITFESEMDRTYVRTPDMVAILDHGKRRGFCIEKQGLPDVVVWNPWKKTAKGMADFGNDEYERMVCVDGAAMKDPITLKPGEEWRGQLQYYLIQSTEPQFSNAANQLPVADVAPHSSLQHII